MAAISAIPARPRRKSLRLSAFRSFSTRRIDEYRNTPGARLWQRNDYEHIVRTGKALADIRAHTQDNPARWTTDPYCLVDAGAAFAG